MEQMKQTYALAYDQYHIQSSYKIEMKDIKKIVNAFAKNSTPVQSALGGRTGVHKVSSSVLGPLIIKHYHRGGLIRYFNRNKYIKWGKTRCQMEFDGMEHAKKCNINVPDPILTAHKGALFYQCWLVTREISGLKSLAELCIENENRIDHMMSQVKRELTKMIENNIYHVDFHPGNVLFDENNKPYIIDFDKAYIFNGKRRKLVKKYLNRWNRAVKKHELPETLFDLLKAYLQ